MPMQCCKDKFPTIPDEEPVFTLRAKDVHALGALDAWIDMALDGGGVPLEKMEAVYKHRDAFLEFKRKYPERMKIPD